MHGGLRFQVLLLSAISFAKSNSRSQRGLSQIHGTPYTSRSPFGCPFKTTKPWQPWHPRNTRPVLPSVAVRRSSGFRRTQLEMKSLRGDSAGWRPAAGGWLRFLGQSPTCITSICFSPLGKKHNKNKNLSSSDRFPLRPEKEIIIITNTHIYIYIFHQMEDNVNPGVISPWLILIEGCPLFGGDSDHFWREHPPNHGTGLLILDQHYSKRQTKKVNPKPCKDLVTKAALVGWDCS